MTKKGKKHMDFLKVILGDELFQQVSEKINAHNGNEANKDNLIKIANLGGGDYVSKLKYDDIVQQLTGKQSELDTANGLIADLKKSAKSDEDLQGKVAAYEKQIAQHQAEMEQVKLDAEIRVALLEAEATDIDYLTYCLKNKGETLEFGEDGKIKGIDDMIAGLKTQHPAQFKTASQLKVEPQPLPNNAGERTVEPKNLAEALKMEYENK